VEAAFKFRAFLSYRAADAPLAERLHRRLETYVVPRALVGKQGEHGVIPRRLGRIFRDRDEARSAERIEDVIAAELSRSQHLIVLCTPNAVASGSWVPREIALFRERRPDGPIHAVIGAGTPPDCFPPSLLRATPDGRMEAPLAADLRPVKDGGADGEPRAVVRLVAALLGVDFDDLWRREERRKRVRRVTRALEVACVAAVAVAAIALGHWYRTHTRLSVDLAPIVDAATSVRIVATEETPNQNRSRTVLDAAVSSGQLTRWIPASNVVVRVIGRYPDGAERAVSWHLLATPGFSLQAKTTRLAAPSKEEILAHPGMAYVPTASWIHGRENEPRRNEQAFWIDIRPPTMTEYVPRAQRLLDSGALRTDESFVLTARRQSAGIDATDLGQLRSLGKGLGDIFGVIAQATSSHVSAPGDIVTGLVATPCDTCPAPMTRHEADVYCRSRGMRLPTALEWELAVRGVDGRTYPWGDRFDATRANVPGPPEKGEDPPSLKPVDSYRDQVSPFGLFDTVGNAGDWVMDGDSSGQRQYMGATYRFNPEDATAFRTLPVTDSDYLIREITARCVAPAADATVSG
jgi:hypothetical protein